jgi:hypothetical protein
VQAQGNKSHAPLDARGLERLRTEADAGVTLDPGTGAVRFVRGKPRQPAAPWTTLARPLSVTYRIVDGQRDAGVRLTSPPTTLGERTIVIPALSISGQIVRFASAATSMRRYQDDVLSVSVSRWLRGVRWRSRVTRLLLPLCLVVFATCASAQRGENKAPADADVVSSSELFYSQSGGFAGRVHSARLEATGGTVIVEYRPGEVRISQRTQEGTMPREVYLSLWREVEALKPWSRESRKPPAGAADMIVHELRMRMGTDSKTLTWTEGTAISDVAAAATRILAAAREHTLGR